MFLICLLLWILFNGRITPEILLFGIAVSAGIYALSCILFGFSFEKDRVLVKILPGIPKMFFALISEMVKSNLSVTEMIWSGRKLSPTFKTFETHLHSTAARVALADCITLTPGTITGILDGDHLTMHCIDVSMTDGKEEARFIRQLQKIEALAEAER